VNTQAPGRGPKGGINRASVNMGKLSSLDRQFLPASIEIMESPPSPVKIAIIWAICMIFALSLAGSYFGKLEIFAVAPGKIQPVGRSKIVQPFDTGKAVAVFVENGTHVDKGQSLLQMDDIETGADRQSLMKELEAINAEVVRRHVAVSAALTSTLETLSIEFPETIGREFQKRENAVLTADIAELVQSRKMLLAQSEENSAAKQRLTSTINARAKLLMLSQERVDMREFLKNLGAGSRALVIEAQQQYETTVVQDASERGQLAETEAAQRTIQQRLIEVTTHFIADQTQKLSDAERKADKLTQDLVKSESRHARTTLRSPISGTVQELSVTTIGQVLSAGQTIMNIVPEDAPIEIEVLVSNQDIGFVEVGQKAAIKLDAFPFTRYGTLEGTIVKLSRDAVDDVDASGDQQSPQNRSVQAGQASRRALARPQRLVYPAIIVLKRKTLHVDDKDVALVAGMALTAEIKTGSRRAIDYLLSPFRETTSRVGSER
jgi:hemolysin D